MIVSHKSCLDNYFARPLSRYMQVLLQKTSKHVISSVKQLDSNFNVDHRNSTFVFISLCHRLFLIGWCLNLNCAVEFSHYSFPPFRSWWEWLTQSHLCLCCCLCQLALSFTLAFFRTWHLATQFLTLSCLFFFILFCLDTDRFCSLAFFASWILVLISFIFE